MTPLAIAIFSVLRTRVPTLGDPRISYSDLVDQLPADFNELNVRDQDNRDELSSALGEIVSACRARGLPALSAIVVSHGSRVPGEGYYAEAYADENSREEKIALWGREFEAVRLQSYPNQL